MCIYGTLLVLFFDSDPSSFLLHEVIKKTHPTQIKTQEKKNNENKRKKWECLKIVPIPPA
jgi:hypothetical protein